MLYEEVVSDKELPLKMRNLHRRTLKYLGYKCYCFDEDNAYYWIKRELGTWEKKDLRPVNDEEILRTI